MARDDLLIKNKTSYHRCLSLVPIHPIDNYIILSSLEKGKKKTKNDKIKLHHRCLYHTTNVIHSIDYNCTIL